VLSAASFAPFACGADSQNPLNNAVTGEDGKPAIQVPTVAAALSNALKQVEGEIGALAAQTNVAPNPERVFRDAKLSEIRKAIQERLAMVSRLESKIPASSPREISGLPDASLPPTVIVLDQLRGMVASRKATQLKYHEVVETAVQEADYAKKQLLTRRQELRALKELATPGAEQEQLIRRLPYEIRLFEQTSELEQLRLKLVRHDEELVQQELAEIEKRLANLRRKVTFPQAEFQEMLIQLDQREAQLNRQSDDLKFTLRIKEAEAPSPESLDEVRVLQRQIEALEERRQRIPDDRLTWQRRYEMFSNKPARSIRFEWENDARKQLARLERLIRVKQIRIDELKQYLVNRTPEDDAEKLDQIPEARMVKAVDGVMISLKRSQDLEQHLLDDCAMLSSVAPLSDAWIRVKDLAHNAWFYEITSIDDRPITVRKIILALLLLLLGIRFVRWLSQILIRTVLRKVKVEESTTIAISTLMFYALAVLVFVAALGFAGIPMTLFTLLGGALAIGLGFGSQNIINNFISGLILLLERPIRVNDMVDVGGTNGKVIRVGLRCTQVRTFNNIDIMVPNSTFLESNVINWTLTDDRARGELFIGLGYGSDTKRAKALMLEAAKEHSKILRSPAPEVMFMDFGDNALIFRMYIWVHMRSPSDRDRVLSDLRFKVDYMFREAGLVIAYPQQDVHLDTLKPLDIRLVRDDGKSD
jgi:small-conductance mechanosensitive channel